MISIGKVEIQKLILKNGILLYTPFVGRCFFSFPLCVPLLYEKTDVFVTKWQDQRRPREWYKCPGFEAAGKMTLFGLGG